MPKKSTISEIELFAKHLYAMARKCYESETPINNDEYNIKISCYGRTIEIDLNADFLENLETTLFNEIDYMKKHE